MQGKKTKNSTKKTDTHNNINELTREKLDGIVSDALLAIEAGNDYIDGEYSEKELSIDDRKNKCRELKRSMLLSASSAIESVQSFHDKIFIADSLSQEISARFANADKIFENEELHLFLQTFVDLVQKNMEIMINKASDDIIKKIGVYKNTVKPQDTGSYYKCDTFFEYSNNGSKSTSLFIRELTMGEVRKFDEMNIVGLIKSIYNNANGNVNYTIMNLCENHKLIDGVLKLNDVVQIFYDENFNHIESRIIEDMSPTEALFFFTVFCYIHATDIFIKLKKK